jgi:hypothetical protein
MPSNRGPQRAASNRAHERSSLFSKAFARVRRCEAAYRLVFVRPALPVPRLGRDREVRNYMNIILVSKDYEYQEF